MSPKNKSASGNSSFTAATEPGSAAAETAAPIPFVVGIGASAGGLEALEHFFAVMPPDCGLSYVVIMHLLPEEPAHLPALLRRYTPMEVVTAAEGLPLAPNTVYVLPYGWDLTLENERFQLAEPAPSLRPHHPVDRFFASLAGALAERAVAVVLSGSGTDGAAGVKKIREAGGIVLVQDPEAALSPGMPRSAIATGAADFVLTAEQLPEKITEIIRGTCTLPPRTCQTNTLGEELQTICTIVKAKTSHDFSSYKANTVLRRIERRMAVNETGGFRKYIVLLRDDPQEAKALCQDILIGVTSFFRDPEAFEILRQQVIPRLFAERKPDEPVRIWHACCASGEEVYSMAMLIREYLDEQQLETRVQLFATDLDEAAIAQARAGLYSDDITADVGEERLQRFFTRVDHRWQIAKALREMVVFAHHNLLKDPPFSRLDLLVCRNFLIYLNPDMQRRLLPLFHQVLKPGGILFLGSAETVGRHSELFTPLDKKWKIFARRENRSRVEKAFPFTATIRRPPEIVRPGTLAGDEAVGPGAAAQKLLMKRYSPPCVVVNEKYEVVYVSTRMGRFLEVPVGEPSRDLLRMAREELRPPLRAAIYKTFAEGKEVVFRGVKVAIDGGSVTVSVQAEPLHAPPFGKLAMVVIAPAAAPSTLTTPLGAEEGGDDTSRETLIRQLEEQLHITHEQLQAVSEQLETSNEGFMAANEELISMNEELQSANEELQSTNEELETSKEELSALNEELVTVNSELHGKVEELDQANSDMENLLASSEIATLFLDRRLAIKRFTPAMAAIFNLIPADIGRPFRHLTGTIDWSGLPADAEEVLKQRLPIEREVTAQESGRHYLLRVLPYLSAHSVIDGIVVTLVDITTHKRAEEAVHRAKEEWERTFNSVPDLIAILNEQHHIVRVNQAMAQRLGLSPEECVGLPCYAVIHGTECPPAFCPHTMTLADRREHQAEVHEDLLGGNFLVSTTPLHDASGKLTGSVHVARDITGRKQAEEALRASEERVRRKLDSILSPEGEIGDLDLADLIDAPPMQSLMDNFYKLTHMPMGMIDLKGNILVGVGWQEICTKFHRVHPETCKNCIESDTLLTTGVPQGEFKLYKCKNNMWDVSTPIMVGGRHFGNFFMGQFFFEDEPVDYDFFRAQARQYGFDEEEYLACLERVPRLSRETLNTGMAYFMELAGMISLQSYSNLKLARSLAERDALMASLQENEERLQRAQRISHLGSWELDLVNNRLTWSDEVYRIFGLQPQEFAATYEAFLAAVHPDDRAAVDAAYSSSLREGRDSYEIEHRVVRKSSGEVRIVREKCEHFRDDAGTIIRSVGMVHDITERKRAEDSLQESELFYRQMLESIPGMVFTTRPDGYCDYQSQQWVDFTGVPMIEHLGDGWNKLLHPDDRPRAFAAWAAAVEERAPYDLEYRVRRHDGAYEWFKVRGRPIRNEAGEIVRWFGTAMNIDDMLKAQEALRKSSERVDLMAATSSELLACDSPQQVVDELCQKVMAFLDCHAFFNFLVDEKEGRLHLNACAGIPEAEKAKIEWLDYGVAICGCAARDACRIVAEDIPNTPDPRTELVKSYGIQAYACHPLLSQGRVIGTLSFGTRSRISFSDDDLALMKAVTDQVAIAMERKRVEEALHIAKESAEAATRTKSQFLANMSHELRTPMTGVLGMLDLALAGKLEPEQRKFIAMAQTAGRSLLRIINDILDLTKIEMGKLSLEEKPFILRNCLASTFNIFLPVARNKGLDFTLSVADDLPMTLVGDQTRLGQVLTNLVGNAIKFTAKGQVELQVTASGSPGNKQDITFTVTDSGIGIPPDKKDLLFRVFSQVDESHSREYGGTGLGLVISREIVERMGGTITFTSEAGKGSSFSCTIPFEAAAAEQGTGLAPGRPTARDARRDEQTRRPRLLIAEDDPIISQVLGAMLRRSDYDLDFVDNGQKAVEMWEGGEYNLILMDVQMPRLNGFEATAAIREQERSRGGHIPIIAMTAHALKEDEERCLAAGMDSYISKPIDFQKTQQVIAEILREKHAEERR